MKTDFERKWKRRKDFSKLPYKLSIFLALYFGLYKKIYTRDREWRYSTYIMPFHNEFDCLTYIFKSHDVKQNNKSFREGLLEEWHSKNQYSNKSNLVHDVLFDFISDYSGYQNVLEGIHYLGNTDKIIKGLQELQELNSKQV